MKGKWQSVVLFIYCWLSCYWLHKLKLVHMAINVWRGKSGVHWDNEDGCGIVPETEKVWQEHLNGGVSMILSVLFLFWLHFQSNEHLTPMDDAVTTLPTKKILPWTCRMVTKTEDSLVFSWEGRHIPFVLLLFWTFILDISFHFCDLHSEFYIHFKFTLYPFSQFPLFLQKCFHGITIFALCDTFTNATKQRFYGYDESLWAFPLFFFCVLPQFIMTWSLSLPLSYDVLIHTA